MLEVLSLPEPNLHQKFRLKSEWNYTLIRMMLMIWRNPKQILLPVPEIWLADLDPGTCPTWQSKSPVLCTRTLSCWNRQTSSKTIQHFQNVIVLSNIKIQNHWTSQTLLLGRGAHILLAMKFICLLKKNNLDQLKLELVLDVQSYCWPARPVDELKPAWKCSNWHQQWSGHLFWSWL